MKKLMVSGMVVALLATSCQASETDSDPNLIVGSLWNSMLKGEITKQDMRIKMETLARKHKSLIDDSFNPDNLSVHSSDLSWCQSALRVLREMGEKQSLRLIEEMSQGKHWFIRIDAISTYVKIAGPVDALPFIDRVDTRGASSLHKRLDQTAAYQALGSLIQEDKIPPEVESFVAPRPPLPVLSPAEQKKVHLFMLEKTQTNKRENLVEQMDEILSEQLTGYKTSVQRLAVAERFPEGNYWKAAKEEIEKIPANERKDFRAKSELLDPEKKGD